MRNLKEIPREQLPPAMAWLPDVIDSLQRATWGALTGEWELYAHVDPLRKIVYMQMVGDLHEHIADCRKIIKQWGEENDCYVRSVKEIPGCLKVDVFHKERTGPKHNYNPFTAEGNKGRGTR